LPLLSLQKITLKNKNIIACYFYSL